MKRFIDDTVCYKTKYKGFNIWYNEIHKKGTKQKKVKTSKGIKVIDIERQDDKI